MNTISVARLSDYLQASDARHRTIAYGDVEHVQVTRSFLNRREAMPKTLLRGLKARRPA